MLSADKWLLESGGDALVPRVFTEKIRGAMRIAAANEVALALGIGPGLTLADARARVPDLESVECDPQGDRQLLDQIADDCDRYTPAVALDLPDGLILDIAGCAHLWDGEAGLVSDLAARLAAHGFTLKLALAATPDQARALARFGGELLSVRRGVPPGQVNEARALYLPPPPDPALLYRLPVAALGLAPDAILALRRAGLRTLGCLAIRPRAPLAARFGKVAVAKLARVLGEEDIRITPRRALPALVVARRFAQPVAHTEFVLGAIGDLVAEAAIALDARGQGGRAFAVRLYRSDGAVHALRIATGKPTRDPALVLRLLRERIDTLADPLDPGFGYDMIRLAVPGSEALSPDQIALDGNSDTGAAAGALIDRLGVRLGTDRVRRFAAGDSHIPECAGFTVPAHAPALPFAHPAPEPGEPPLRPLHLFDPPQLIDVIAEVPDGPPRAFRWRRRMHDIVAHEGPERIAAEWWRRKRGHEPGQSGLTRDYFRVEDREGRRFWLFRHGLYGAEQQSPEWYLHGRFA